MTPNIDRFGRLIGPTDFTPDSSRLLIHSKIESYLPARKAILISSSKRSTLDGMR